MLSIKSFDPSKITLLQICLAAIALRVIWVLLIPVIPISDSYAYDVFAQNIWQHGTYGWNADEPTSYWPVGLSGIYSGFYFLFGHTYTPIVIFNIACSVAIIIYTKKLCDRFFEHQNIGIYAAIIIALWPTLIFYCSVLASELPYLAFLLAAIYYLSDLKSGFIKQGIIGGILFAITYYIRPLATIPLFITIFYLLINHSEKKLVVFRSIITIGLIVIAVFPWAQRNYSLYDAYVPMSTNSGATFWMGNQPDTDGGYKELPDYVDGLNEYERNNTLKAEALEYIKEEPVEFLVRTTKKFFIFHLHETIGVTWNKEGIKQRFGDWAILPLKLIGQAYWSLFLLLGLAGLVLHILHKGFWTTAFHPFTLIWAATAGVHAIIVSQDRYHLPIIPMVTAYGAYALYYYQSKYYPSKNSQTTSS